MIEVIILAAGRGLRMKSDGPKVLVQMLGRPLISHLLSEVQKICPKPTLVVGYKADEVIAATGGNLTYVTQPEQLGTGHAVACAKSVLEHLPASDIVVLYGDHPFVSAATLTKLASIRKETGAVCAMATFSVPSFDGDFAGLLHFGRIVRDSKGDICRILEYKDANDEQRVELRELNPGYYCFDAAWLWKNIEKLQNQNACKEYYLTDMIALAIKEEERVATTPIDPIEGMGANTPEELAVLERISSKT